MPAPRLVHRRAFLVAVLLPLLSASLSVATTTEPGPPAGGLRPEAIPQRPDGAMTGTRFAEATTGVGGAERQRRAASELTAGNLPDRLRTFVPVPMRHVRSAGDTLTAVIWVAPDYLAIGSDADFLRMPLDHLTATRVATAFGCVLPTRKMVDAIYRQARTKLAPSPMEPGPRMRSSGYYLRHQRTIEAQRRQAAADSTRSAATPALVAGHKKDVVLTNRLHQKPGRIAIYGWQRPGGRPIQPLSTVHTADYADYSHGLRLVYGRAWVAGQWRQVLDVLADAKLAPVLTYEGTIERPRQLMGAKARPR